MRLIRKHASMHRALFPFIVIIACPTGASGAIITTSPFVGQFSDNFDHFTQVNAVQSLPVFGGLGTLNNLSPGGAIKVEFGSLFQGHQVVPISGMMVGQLGVGEWNFTQPALSFGGWFENNSGQPDANVKFFDAQNTLIGQVTANIPFGGTWTWNGWTSDVPFSRIVVTGNGVVNGFLWYENMQVTFVPSPSALALLTLASVAGRSRRRCPAK